MVLIGEIGQAFIRKDLKRAGPKDPKAGWKACPTLIQTPLRSNEYLPHNHSYQIDSQKTKTALI